MAGDGEWVDEVVWQLWDCQDCGARGVSCKHDVCPTCGHRRTFEEFDARYMPREVEADGRVSAGLERASAAEQAQLARAGVSWFCTNCRADNPGDQARCRFCEAPRGATEQGLMDDASFRVFEVYADTREGDRGATAELVEQFGEYAGQRAAAGLSFDMAGAKEGQLEASVRDRDAFGANASASRPAWEEGELPSSVESAARIAEEAAGEEEERAPVGGRGWSGLKLVAVLGVALAGVVGLVAALVWAFSTHEVSGEVTALRWSQTTLRETWRPYTGEDWRHNLRERPTVMPVNGRGEVAGIDIGSCRRAHFSDEKYACGTQRKCETRTRQVKSGSKQECRYVDNGNGSSSRKCKNVPTYRSESYQDCKDVTKYCTRPIYKDRCAYSSWRWEEAERKTVRGEGLETRWPELSAGSRDRLRRTSDYDVVVTYDDGEVETTTLNPASEAEYKSWRLGEPVVLEVNNLGGVSATHRQGKGL